MKFATSLLAASTVALASAQSSIIFSLKAINENAPYINNQNIVWYEDGLAIGPKQNASCGDPAINYASFFNSDDGGLYLYTDNPPAQAYVDLSKEGQGRIRFSRGVTQVVDPNKYSRGPFEYAQGNLYFVNGDKYLNFQACGLQDGTGYEVFVKPFDEVAGPSCYEFDARAIERPDPVKCIYNGF